MMINLLIIYSNLLIIPNTTNSLKIEYNNQENGHNFNKQSSILKSFCLRNFRKEMQQSSLSIPSGMGIYTCKCFLKQLRSGKSVSIAKTNCKEKAAKKYEL